MSRAVRGRWWRNCFFDDGEAVFKRNARSQDDGIVRPDPRQNLDQRAVVGSKLDLRAVGETVAHNVDDAVGLARVFHHTGGWHREVVRDRLENDRGRAIHAFTQKALGVRKVDLDAHCARRGIFGFGHPRDG